MLFFPLFSAASPFAWGGAVGNLVQRLAACSFVTARPRETFLSAAPATFPQEDQRLKPWLRRIGQVGAPGGRAVGSIYLLLRSGLLSMIKAGERGKKMAIFCRDWHGAGRAAGEAVLRDRDDTRRVFPEDAWTVTAATGHRGHDLLFIAGTVIAVQAVLLDRRISSERALPRPRSIGSSWSWRASASTSATSPSPPGASRLRLPWWKRNRLLQDGAKRAEAAGACLCWRQQRRGAAFGLGKGRWLRRQRGAEVTLRGDQQVDGRDQQEIVIDDGRAAGGVVVAGAGDLKLFSQLL